jgi:hypothetical protein
LTILCCAPASAQPSEAPLLLEAKIPLGAVRGRIDHMAIDLGRHPGVLLRAAER